RDYRQKNVRWLRARMLNGLPGNSHSCTGAELLAGVGIAIELRKMAAGDVHANAVSGQKDIAGPNQVDGELVRLAGFEQFRSSRAVAISPPVNAFTLVDGSSIGKHVDQLRDEVRIGRVG